MLIRTMQTVDIAGLAHLMAATPLWQRYDAAVQRCYTRLGYQQIGAIPAFVLPDITELIFIKVKRDA